MLQSAAEQYRAQQRLTATTTAAVAHLWRRMDDDFDASWARIAPDTLTVVEQGRAAAVQTALGYTDDVLAQTGQRAPATGDLNPAAFLRTAPDGRDVSTLLDQSIITAKTSVAAGAAPEAALAVAGRWLTMATLTLMADTRREVYQADIGQRPALGGYTRMLNPPSCSRCVILAGKWFRWNTGFERHPRCFPAGVVVSGPSVVGATRRWYEGELVILSTSSGEQLPVTGNHPILTRRGWVPANLIEEGDEVVRSTRAEGASALVVPDHDQVPARIEDVWDALSVSGFDRVESSTEDFHGDGQDGEVDVVRADGSLRDRVLASLREHAHEEGLAVAGARPLLLDRQCASQLFSLRHGARSGGTVRGGDLRSLVGVAEASVADHSCFAHAASRDSGFSEYARYWSSRYSVLTSEPVLGSALEVLPNDGFGGQLADSPRWDAPGDAFVVETREGYAAVGRDLLDRLAGQVQLDRVVEVRRVQWSGHVYSLNSSEGWHVANSLIVSNCDCQHIPSSENVAGDLRTDPYKAFSSMSPAEQDKAFGRINARAIRDGADIYRVVNIEQRGLATASSARRYGTPHRRTIDDIYRTAGTRNNAIRMMREEGYLLDRGQVAIARSPGVRTDAEIIRVGRGRGTVTLGGVPTTTNRAARFDAAASGERDPLRRSTMTAAERRLYDAHYRLDYARRTGTIPRSVGPSSADRYANPIPATPQRLAELERALTREIRALQDRGTPESVRRLARLLGLL